jgi:hypothetical protein
MNDSEIRTHSCYLYSGYEPTKKSDDSFISSNERRKRKKKQMISSDSSVSFLSYDWRKERSLRFLISS